MKNFDNRKILKINEYYVRLLDEKNVEGIYNYDDIKLDYINSIGLNISHFRYTLHCIVNNLDLSFRAKKIINSEISDNNFTSLILLGILNIVEKE